MRFNEKDLLNFGYFCVRHYQAKVKPKKSFPVLLENWKNGEDKMFNEVFQEKITMDSTSNKNYKEFIPHFFFITLFCLIGFLIIWFTEQPNVNSHGIACIFIPIYIASTGYLMYQARFKRL